jgi:hypothetical protein
MGNSTYSVPVDEKSLQRLRDDYDVAFRNWSAQVRVLQSVSSSETPDRDAIEQARRWAEEAAAIYREKRNLFLNHVMATRSQTAGQQAPSGAGPLASAADSQHEGSAALTSPVQRLARRIWEEAGRPDGTAEADWRQAEDIIHTRR